MTHIHTQRKRFSRFCEDEAKFDSILNEELNRLFYSENLLSEKIIPQWSASTLIHVLACRIPMTNAIYDEITKQIRGTVYHMTDVEGLEHILKTQKQKKALSVSPNIPKESGVWRSGLIIKLDADITFGGFGDIMSHPDDSGRRWLGANFIGGDYSTMRHDAKKFTQKMSNLLYDMAIDLEMTLKKIIEKFNPEDQKIYSRKIDDLIFDIKDSIENKVMNSTTGIHLKGSNYFNYKGLPDIIKKTIGKTFHNMIKKYMESVKIFFKDIQKSVKEQVLNVMRKSKHYTYYDEFLANNFIVQAVVFGDAGYYQEIDHLTKGKNIPTALKLTNNYYLEVRLHPNIETATDIFDAYNKGKIKHSNKFQKMFEKRSYRGI